MGLCAGSFAAAAISTSQTITELIPAAVEAVVVAFRTGFHSLRLRRDAETHGSSKSRSWSCVMGMLVEKATDLIRSFNSETVSISPFRCKFRRADLQKSRPQSSQVYISAVGPSHVTISGPPSVLSDFLATKSLKASALPIESPYHAPHLCTAEDVEEVVGAIQDTTLEAYKPRIPVLSPVSGTAIAAPEYASLLRQAVKDALCDQLRWDQILSSCIGLASQSTSSESWTIWPVTSNAAEQLSNRCNSASESRVSLCNSLNTHVEIPSSETQTGKFGDSKIAVIGFSGRFPEAASTDELWEVLHAGRDTHRTIPADRFDWEAHYDLTGKRKNTSQVKYGCFINEPVSHICCLFT